MAEVVIQVNGKVRDRLMLAADLAEADARTQALAQPKIVEVLGGRKPKKVIYVPGWLVSIVA